MAKVDDELVHWASIRETYDGHGLLIGNGASMAVWERFSYPSLYEEAPLTELDKSVFEALDTTNFELILDSLRISEVICNAVGHDRAEVHERYLSIRKSLFDAVRSVHVGWDRIPQETFSSIEQELHCYETVFSTNYDLLAYWSIMFRETERIRDFFWNPDLAFDPTNTELSGKASTIFYLHGGIHLYVDTRTGATVKRKPDAGGLLSFRDMAHTTRRPLFISEGRSSDKLRSIRSSDYLSFAYQTLAEYSDPLVIFGHSLGEADAHIAQAIKSQEKRRIAIGLHPGKSMMIIKDKTRLEDILDGQLIEYFDASTHPLGGPGMKISILPVCQMAGHGIITASRGGSLTDRLLSRFSGSGQETCYQPLLPVNTGKHTGVLDPHRLQIPRVQAEQLQDRRRDLGRLHRVA